MLPQAAYDEYADRGESENRNKEIKCGLEADRLSDHRYLANLFRLYLHAAASIFWYGYATTWPTRRRRIPLLNFRTRLSRRCRRRFFNQRRERNPLGEGQACTWRMRLVKVAARVIETTRRILVRLSGSWPHLEHYRQVSQQILGLSPPAPESG